jgi:hypothetical protein
LPAAPYAWIKILPSSPKHSAALARHLIATQNLTEMPRESGQIRRTPLFFNSLASLAGLKSPPN